MVVVILVEVVTRSLFHFSFEVVDEVGGYLTVAVSFLALAPAQARKAFHNVALVQNRISKRAQTAWLAFFHLLSLVFCLTVTGAMARFVYRSWEQGDVASTVMRTQLWIPQSFMVIGMGVLSLVLAAELLAAVRRYRSSKAINES
jgi:TRAP-type C4-dicarboxylate transport system permease small subunit